MLSEAGFKAYVLRTRNTCTEHTKKQNTLKSLSSQSGKLFS